MLRDTAKLLHYEGEKNFIDFTRENVINKIDVLFCYGVHKHNLKSVGCSIGKEN